MSDQRHKWEHLMERFILARDSASYQLKEMLSRLESGEMLSEEAYESIKNSLISVLQIQNETFNAIPSTYDRPSSVDELKEIVDDLERSSLLLARVERAQRSIEAFVRLQCLDDAVAQEFVQQQAKAESLLQQLSEEELAKAGEVYAKVVQFIRNPAESDDHADMYKQITKSIGVATRYALEQNWLFWPDDDFSDDRKEAAGIVIAGHTAEAEEESKGFEDRSAVSNAFAETTIADETKEILPGISTDRVDCPTPDTSKVFDGASSIPEREPLASCLMSSLEQATTAPPFNDAFAKAQESLFDFTTVKYDCIYKKKNINNFSSNKFEGELKQASVIPRLPALIMCCLYNDRVVADSQLETIWANPMRESGRTSGNPDEIVRNTIKKLVQKGYVTEHVVELAEKSEVFYTLSMYGAVAFQKDSSRRLLQTLSQKKLFAETEEARQMFGSDRGVAVADFFRVQHINVALQALSKHVPEQLTATQVIMQPFPHREVADKKTRSRYLLIPGILDAKDPQTDLALVIEMANNKNNCIPLVVVDSMREGTYWVEWLSSTERQAYYLCIENLLPIIGGKEGSDQLSVLFQLPETNTGSSCAKQPLTEPAATQEVSAPQDQLEIRTIDPVFQDEVVETGPTQRSDQQKSESSALVSADDLNEVVESALSRLAEGNWAEGMLLLHTVAGFSKDVEVLRDKISFILNDPLCREEDWHTLADMPITLPYGEFEMLDDSVKAAMWLKIFFDPKDPNDYRLKNRWKQISNDISSDVLETFPSIKKLIGHFWTFIDRNNIGIKYCVSSDVRDQLDVQLAIKQVEKHIEETIETVFPRNTMSKINHPKIKEMVVELYGNSGLMTRYLQNAPGMRLAELREVCQLFTETDLSVDSVGPDLKPTDAKLEQFLDKYWVGMSNWVSNDKSTMLTGAFRNRMRNWLREATDPLLRYYACRCAETSMSGSTYISPEMASKARQESQQLVFEAMKQLEEQSILLDKVSHGLLHSTIRDLQAAFEESDDEREQHFYESLLLSGEIELDSDYLPIMDEEWLPSIQPVAGYTLRERLLRHHSKKFQTWEEAADHALRNYDMGMYDLIAKRSGERLSDTTVSETRRKAPQQLMKYNDDFRAEVELAQNYGQMASNDEMYGYIKLAEAAKKHAEKTLNVGFFKRLLVHCRAQIVRGSDTRMEATRSRLDALKEDTLLSADRDDLASDEEVLRQWPILDKIERALERRNMTVAEDYIQLAASGRKDTPSLQMFDSDLYKVFLERYQGLFQACNAHKRDDLYRVYNQSVRSQLFPNQNNRNTASAEKLIRQWYKLQPQQISEFMEQLLFHKVEKVVKERENEFYVFPAARDAQLGQYPHPFKEFGTEAVRKGVRVLAMAGVRTADNLLDEVTQRGSGNGAATIVVLDYALPLADRKLLAKSIKLRSIPEIIVVIDRVMALFLAGYSQTDRADAFLRIALPSSKIQPYIPVGGIPPEMFIGRTDELEKIRSMNGPVFVYGGRQLGKTALLREAKNREHDPEKGRYAVFVDLREKNTDTTLRIMSEELVIEKVLTQPCNTWDELRIALRTRLLDKDRPIHKLMLLLDEADAFLASCESCQNKPLEILKELKDTFNGQFKFVLAGLRDVVRFNKRLLGGNSVLAHLGHITIRPLEYLDARDLLLRPLHYLGFRIEENGEDIISLILAKTNYYPGLIHFYCQKLIEAITDSYRNGNYNENANPPYLLDEKHIKTLLGQRELLTEIENKFRITLQLDTDNLYDILAKAIAYRYYVVGIGQSSSAQDIIEVCKEFNINKIVNLSEDSVKALLEEMDELNIIRRETRGSDHYVFNRYSFFQMLGSSEDELFYQLYELGEN
ncbi:ATP-binding protein [Brevibacillus gelatini]|uniref:AAA family ATPase n=1 Tax=Brevibacillus gelatini TaxID=1655277 RepID=UPI003D81777A